MCTSSTAVAVSPVEELRDALDGRNEATIATAVDSLHNQIHWADDEGESPDWLSELRGESGRQLAARLATVIRRSSCGAAQFAAPRRDGCGGETPFRHACRKFAHMLWHLGSAGARELAEFGLRPADVKDCVYETRPEERADGGRQTSRTWDL